MRRACWLILIGAVALGACGEEKPSPLVNEMRWQVYCASGCAAGEPHDVTGFNKDSDKSVSCAVTGNSVAFTVVDKTQGNDSLQVLAGDATAGTCVVTVRDGGATYKDSCTNSTAPSAPGKGCTLTGQALASDSWKGTLKCTNLFQQAAPASEPPRSVAKSSIGEPINIELANCD